MTTVDWAEVKDGDVLPSGDEVTGLHAIQEGVDGFRIYRRSRRKGLVVSADHLFQVRFAAIPEGFIDGHEYNIPEDLADLLLSTKTYKDVDYHLTTDEMMTEEELFKRITIGPALDLDKADYYNEDEPLAPGLFWVPAWAIHYYLHKGIKIYNHKWKHLRSEYVGMIDARCVTTDSGVYEINGLISHNSVAIRNIFFHCIEHAQDIKIAGIDMKVTEFSQWKGHKDVIGIANDLQTAVEILRLGRECMNSRNKKMAEFGITNFTDHIPAERDGWEYISGMRFKSRDKLEVKIGDKTETKAAAEIVDLALKVIPNDKGDAEPLMVKSPTNVWLETSKFTVKHGYKDDLGPALLIVIDEFAELALKSGGSSAREKAENEIRDEIVYLITSITQLGRSAGIHMAIITQRNDAKLIPGMIQNNPLAVETQLRVVRDDGTEETVTMGEVKIGDYVYGADKELFEVKDLTETKVPEKMYRLHFSDGYVDSSGDHVWSFSDSKDAVHLVSAKRVFELNTLFQGMKAGVASGSALVGIEEIEPRESKCIMLDSEDHLFEVLTDSGEPVLTHNCGFRGVAGRLGMVASLMALGNSMGTTVDSSKKGRGIVASQGNEERLQFYYEDHDYIEKYYFDRGLDKKGWPLSKDKLSKGKEEPQKAKPVMVALEDLPEATDEDEALELTDFEYDAEKKSSIKIEEMDIDIEIDGATEPVGNVEI